jgi:hypothetical protein
VAGGKFKSVTNIHQAAPSALLGKLEYILSTEILTLGTDFPVIPLGHINLLQEIGGADVVRRKNSGNSVRRMYAARVHGCTSNMTVALYQGTGGEAVCYIYIFWLIMFSFPFAEMAGLRFTIFKPSVRPFVPLF